MKAKVVVTLKPGVLDPQGKAIENALGALGIDGVADVRQGRYFEIEFEAEDGDTANAKLDDMCRRLLANTVIENYEFDIVE